MVLNDIDDVRKAFNVAVAGLSNEEKTSKVVATFNEAFNDEELNTELTPFGYLKVEDVALTWNVVHVLEPEDMDDIEDILFMDEKEDKT